jgi:hypothetical protein
MFAEPFLSNSCLMSSQSWLLSDMPHILQDSSVFQPFYLVIHLRFWQITFWKLFKKFLRTTNVLLNEVNWVTLNQIPWDLMNLPLDYQDYSSDYRNCYSNWLFFWLLLYECQPRYLLIDTQKHNYVFCVCTLALKYFSWANLLLYDLRGCSLNDSSYVSACQENCLWTSYSIPVHDLTHMLLWQIYHSRAKKWRDNSTAWIHESTVSFCYFILQFHSIQKFSKYSSAS